MDLFTTLIPALFFMFVILFVTGLALLAKHDGNKEFLGDKWGLRGIIVMVLAILSCLGLLISIYVVLLMFWGSDY